VSIGSRRFVSILRRVGVGLAKLDRRKLNQDRLAGGFHGDKQIFLGTAAIH
jgi:hypothetical protein